MHCASCQRNQESGQGYDRDVRVLEVRAFEVHELRGEGCRSLGRRVGLGRSTRRAEKAAGLAAKAALVAIRTRTQGPEHLDTLVARQARAINLFSLGRHEEALAEHEALVEIFTRTQGPEHPATPISREGRALSIEILGRHEEAGATRRRPPLPRTPGRPAPSGAAAKRMRRNAGERRRHCGVGAWSG